MVNLGDIVRRWRQDHGLSQPQLARQLGVTQQAVQQLEAGGTKQPRYLLRLARLMEVDPGALIEGEVVAAPPTPEVAPNAAGPVAAPLGQRDLPVYASAQAGPDGMRVQYEPIEWIERPAPLAGVPGAFAMYVVNDSMEPRYRQGDLLLIHPQRPVRRGQDVLLIQAAADNEHDAFIKELVALDARRVVLRQLNPEKTFEVPRERVSGLHLVVGVYYG
jgi:phage repressor protein C with HTH and peptisase S24 domain/DNA-binding XRE family transcriptional regulator